MSWPSLWDAGGSLWQVGAGRRASDADQESGTCSQEEGEIINTSESGRRRDTGIGLLTLVAGVRRTLKWCFSDTQESVRPQSSQPISLWWV